MIKIGRGQHAIYMLCMSDKTEKKYIAFKYEALQNDRRARITIPIKVVNHMLASAERRTKEIIFSRKIICKEEGFKNERIRRSEEGRQQPANNLYNK